MTAPAALDAPHVAQLGPVERLFLAVLSSGLPAHFQARQRAEWTTDLLVLAERKPTARWRYLLGAASTLPALRALARGCRPEGSGGRPVLSTPSAVALARLIIISLAWPVTAWLFTILGPYLILDVPGQMARDGGYPDPKSIGPTGAFEFLDLPWQLLQLGGWVVVFFLPFVGLVALQLAIYGPRRTDRRRMVAIAIGAALLAASVLGVLPVVLTVPMPAGLGVALMGLAGIWLGVAARGLRMRTRIVLGVLGLAAVAVFLTDVAFGGQMLVWFMD